MAMMNDAPFLKVEATKFTEVGYHGRDVDQIIRDLMDVAMQLAKKRHTDQFKEQAEAMVEDRILDILAGPPSENEAPRAGPDWPAARWPRPAGSGLPAYSLVRYR